MERIEMSQKIDGVRQGWPGVWDALYSALTGEPIRTVAREVTFSVYASAPVELKVTQVEIGAARK